MGENKFWSWVAGSSLKYAMNLGIKPPATHLGQPHLPPPSHFPRQFEAIMHSLILLRGRKLIVNLAQDSRLWKEKNVLASKLNSF